MNEIDRLRKRLGNVQRNVTEYRMTVVEAKKLLAEIDELLEKEKSPKMTITEEPVITRTIDGGSF